MSDEHPARTAGLLSQKHVSEGNRDAWLDLFAEDAVVQDPVGVSPLDPTGKGQIGKTGIAAFYDNVISKGTSASTTHAPMSRETSARSSEPSTTPCPADRSSRRKACSSTA